MTAYLIGRLFVRDPSYRDEYRPKAATLVQKHGGQYLVRGGKMEMVEGNSPLPSGLVVVEFPSMEHARAFYNDPEDAPLIKLRQAHADLDLILVEGT